MPYPGSTTFPGSATFPGISAPVTTIPAVNPNWPVIGVDVDFGSGPPSLPGSNAHSINAKYQRLAVRQIDISRGRQYELDQVQAGTATLAVVDPGEVLNPDNAASPFAGSIIPYRAMRIWAVWPNQPGSGNIIAGTGVNADVSFENGTTGGWFAVGCSDAVSTAQAFDGTHSLLVSSPSGSGVGHSILRTFATIPGVTYTFSCHIFLGTATSVTAQVNKADGTTVTSSAVSGSGWQPLTLTWTPVDTQEQFYIYGTTTGTWYMDAFQLEFGSTANAFTTAGPTTYNLFTGYVERWPTSYELQGTRALRSLVAVDALAVLSRAEINQSYVQTIAADSPLLYVPYNDTAPANLVLRQATVPTTANLTSVLAVRGTQDVTAGGTADWGGDTFLDGTPALSLSLQNTTGATTPVSYMAVDIPHLFSYPVNTSGATFEGWLKWTSGHFHGIFFGYNSGATGTTYNNTWASTSNTFAGLVFTTSGITFYANTAIPGGTTASTPLAGSYAGTSGAFTPNDPTNFAGDGQWHYFAMVFRPNGSNNGWVLDVQIDTAVNTLTPSPAATGYATFNFNQISNEALLTFGDKESKISVANLAYYPSALTLTQRLAHYNRGIGYMNEKSGARVTRLLQTYWSTSAAAINVATGQLSMAPDYQYDPVGQPQSARFVLDVAQEIQESERGLIYADRNGVVVFEDRTSRVGTIAHWVLGENPAGAFPAEYPYSDYGADFDPTYTFTQANLTRPSNDNFPPQPQPLPVNPPYGQRVLTQQLQANTDYDLYQAATFYLTRYANPKTRLSKITLNPAGNPNLWPVVLGMEISQRNTATRRNAGVVVTNDYFVEKIDHHIQATGQDFSWTTDLQLSPTFIPASSAWVLGTGALGTATVPCY